MRKTFNLLTEEQKMDIFCDAVAMLDDEEKHFLKIKLNRMAHHGHLSEEDAHEWVKDMTPRGGHWSKAETDSVLRSHSLPYDTNDWYAVLNMMYSDYYGVVPDTTDTYVKLAKAWFADPDVKDHKTFNYYYNVVKEK